MAKTLLIDSDILAFKVSASNQSNTAFGAYTYEAKARKDADVRVAKLVEKLGATDVIMCLTDDENFRYDVLPTYKDTRDRDESARPELLKDMKQYLAEEYKSYIRPGLEADDIMGILATHPTIVKGEKIIVSEDKDMRTVSAKVYNPMQPDLGVLTITPREAAAFHMWQTICGDVTDGYGGAFRVGKNSDFAQDITFLPMKEMWDEVLMAYARAKQTEEDALAQARVAKILSAPLYDFKNKKPVLWSPINLIDGSEVY